MELADVEARTSSTPQPPYPQTDQGSPWDGDAAPMALATGPKGSPSVSTGKPQRVPYRATASAGPPNAKRAGPGRTARSSKAGASVYADVVHLIEQRPHGGGDAGTGAIKTSCEGDSALSPWAATRIPHPRVTQQHPASACPSTVRAVERNGAKSVPPNASAGPLRSGPTRMPGATVTCESPQAR